MAEYSIGVDLGGTNLRAAAVTRTARSSRRFRAHTDLKAGRDAVIGDIVESVEH